MESRGRVLFAAALCSALLVGCAQDESGPLEPTDLGPQCSHKPGHKPGGGGGGEPDFFPLTVTFRDIGDGVVSDAVVGGSPVYADGVDHVSAHLRSNGHFRLFTAFGLKKNDTPVRKLCFDFGPSAAGIPPSFDADGRGCDETSAGGPVGMVTSDPRDAAGNELPTGMLGMKAGEEITMRSSTYFEVDGFGWRLRYGRDCNLVDFPPNDPRRVTVTGGDDDDGDEFSDSWTIEGGAADAILCRSNLKGRAETTEVGRSPMPFLVTAERF